MRSSQEAHIGDTIYKTGAEVEPLPGFKSSQPMVFAGIFPVDQSQHVSLRSAIEKLVLNDSAVTVTVDSRYRTLCKNLMVVVVLNSTLCYSPALGQGWRLGFLGLLHLEVFKQRLQQEYNVESILTAPSVTYKLKLKETQKTKSDTELYVSNPIHFPEPLKVEEYYEPMVLGTLVK